MRTEIPNILCVLSFTQFWLSRLLVSGLSCKTANFYQLRLCYVPLNAFANILGTFIHLFIFRLYTWRISIHFTHENDIYNIFRIFWVWNDDILCKMMTKIFMKPLENSIIPYFFKFRKKLTFFHEKGSTAVKWRCEPFQFCICIVLFLFRLVCIFLEKLFMESIKWTFYCPNIENVFWWLYS